ncbi:MAG: hypothetical protein WCJ60_02330 [bacterium]
MDDFNEMMPNDGTTFHDLLAEPDEQVKEERAERGRVKAAAPFIDDLLERFDARIAYYSSTSCIDPDLSPDMFHIQFKAAKVIHDNLVTEREWIASLRDHYKN